MRICVTEAIVVEVIGFPQVGRIWFGQKNHNATTVQYFLVAGEHVQRSGHGITRESLPCLWNKVAIFLNKYITCD